jgi:TetR/AcrR family transcriptional repressor of nem operon
MKSSDTPFRLVEVAAQLIHSQGYAATGVASILRDAEVGSGSLYYFFRTKEDLLLAVLTQYRRRLDEEIFDPVRRRFSDPVDRVFGVLDFYRRFLEESGCSLGCPIGNLAGEIGDSHPSVRQRLDELFAAWREGVCGFLEEGRSQFPAETDLDGLATLVLSVMEGAVMQARLARTLEPFDRSTALLREFVEQLRNRV